MRPRTPCKIAALAIAFLTTSLVALPAARADQMDDFHQVQQRIEDTLLDIYGGTVPPADVPALKSAWAQLSTDLTSPESQALAKVDFSATLTPVQLAQTLGDARARLQHIATLEMLQHQEAGDGDNAQAWRVMITLPQFADADEGGLLLHQAPDQIRQPGVSQALAKEYMTWQTSRIRQLLDRLQRAMAGDDVNEALMAANLAEIRTLSNFPATIPTLAAIKTAGTTAGVPMPPAFAAPYTSPATLQAFGDWRDKAESGLPTLLKPEDVTRLQRLLVRFVRVVPKEYQNGVEKAGTVLIPLEYQEATQFTEQAQGLVDELGPIWRRDMPGPYAQHLGDLKAKLATLAKKISDVEEPDAIVAAAKDAGDVLENGFGLSARQAGDHTQVVEETALDVRDALNNSLAAAQAGHWQEAESLRLDAYTSFDSEIEVRVLPRDPALAMRTERSFIDGTGDEQGIKALIDSQAPMDELTAAYERALKNTDECVALLRVSISPTTVGITSFTVIAREGLEAIIVLAALLAGMRGVEHQGSRRWVAGGAWLALAATGITFWLSRTLIQSLSRYGEKLEATVSVLAVIILLMVTNWIFHKFYWTGWNARLRSFSKASREVAAERWEGLALLGVGFLTVYREGFETTLFMQSLLLEGGVWPVIIGALAGFAFIAAIGFGIFIFGAKLPYRKLLIATGGLVVSIMVTFFGSTVRLFQTVGWMSIHPIPKLPIPSWAGLWLGLYPSWEGLLIPPMALVYVIGAWLWVKFSVKRNGNVNIPQAVKTAPAAPAAPAPSASTVASTQAPPKPSPNKKPMEPVSV